MKPIYVFAQYQRCILFRNLIVHSVIDLTVTNVQSILNDIVLSPIELN